MPRLAVFPKGFFDRLVRREMTVFEWIDHAATLGVDGLELYPAFLDGVDAASLAGVRRAAESARPRDSDALPFAGLHQNRSGGPAPGDRSARSTCFA